MGVTGWNFEQAHFALSVDANGEAEFDVKFETDYDAGTWNSSYWNYQFIWSYLF